MENQSVSEKVMDDGYKIGKESKINSRQVELLLNALQYDKQQFIRLVMQFCVKGSQPIPLCIVEDTKDSRSFAHLFLAGIHNASLDNRK